MKVTLISPPHPYLVSETQLPVGLLYVQSVLNNNGHEAEFVNLTSENVNDSINQISGTSDVYGFNSYYIDYPACEQIAIELKKINPTASFIIGGPHVTTLEEKVNMDVFDSRFLKESEHTILEYMKSLQKFKETDNISDKPFERYEGSMIQNLDSLPFPVWPQGTKSTQIMASRGCPFNCGYCASAALWDRRVRKRSLDNVISELRFMKDNGIEYVSFNDDSIAIFDEKYLKGLCSELKDLDLKCSGMLRPHECTPETLQILKGGNFDTLIVGIESGDQACLDKADKTPHTTPAINKIAIENIHAADIKTKLFFMIGLPGETMQTVDRNIAFLESVKGKYEGVSLKSYTPLPGSPIWNNPRKFGVKIIENNLEKFNFFLWTKGQDKPIEDAEITNLISIDGLTDAQLTANKIRMRNHINKMNDLYIGHNVVK